MSSRLLPEEILILDVIFNDQRWDVGLLPENFEINSERLFSLLARNKLLRTFASELILNNKNSTTFLPESIEKDLKQLIQIAEIERAEYFKMLKKIDRILSTNEINYCLLKGYSIDNPQNYRDINDLDILINEDNLEKLHKVLLSEGFKFRGLERKKALTSDDRDRSLTNLIKWSNQFEYKSDNSDLLVEIHTHLFEKERIFRFNMAQIWNTSGKLLQRSVFSTNTGCNILRLPDQLWLIALHNSFRLSVCSHQMVLRYILDMKEIIKKMKAVDWTILIDQTELTRTSGFVLFSLEMIEYFCPDSVPQEITQTIKNNLTKKELFFNRVQHGCLNSLTESKTFYTILYYFFLPFIYHGTMKNKISSLMYGFKLFLPPLGRLIRKYSRKRIKIV